MIELGLRIVFSLFVVIGLLWLIARVARRPLRRRAASGELFVLARQQLTRQAVIATVRVGDRALVLGVTDQQVTLLAEGTPATLGAALEEDEFGVADTVEEHRVPLSLEELIAADVAAQAAEPPRTVPPRASPDRFRAPGGRITSSPGNAPRGRATRARGGNLRGSILSPATWRQAAAAIRGNRK